MDSVQPSLSREELQALRNKRSGLAIFQLSWILVFVCLVVVNWQLRWGYPSWPPPGVSKPDVLLPSVVTLGLLLSGWLAARGSRGLKAGDPAALLANWRITLLLGLAFVLVVGYEAVSMPYSGVYSDVFRLMTGFHIVHALAIGAFMGNIYRGVQAGIYDAANFWPVEGAARLWYFVIVAWMLFYTVLYWL